MSSHEGKRPTAGGDGEGSQKRRERAVIAAQACETCRSRKSKCDEKRPKCSLCKRLNVDCRYREPQPTKKDKSIQQMIDQLSRMESKINVIGHTVNPSSTAFDAAETYGSPGSGISPMSSASPRLSRPETVSSFHPGQTWPSELSSSYRHLTAPHKVLLWPKIYEFLRKSGADDQEMLKILDKEGTPWLLHLELEKHREILPCDTYLSGDPTPGQMAPSLRVKFDDLDEEVMLKCIESYFNTYNVLYPLLVKEDFDSRIFPDVLANGFGYGDFNSVIALLVFSLGKMAYDGVWGDPIDGTTGNSSGIRGGSASRPPGLDLFNEARKRSGFISTQTSLENIQVLQLIAVYYEACSRHLDFWRASVSASMAFQVLIKCESVDWNSPRGHLIRRMYWTCNLLESWYHIDLDLPKTGIADHADSVPLPGEQVQSKDEGPQMQFLAMISLLRLITRTHDTLFEDYCGPPIHVIRELLRQLDHWRALLPAALQWDDNKRFEYPDPPAATAAGSSGPLFSFNSVPATAYELGDSLAMASAQLRSRYYYTRFMILRPFVFKALHYPEQLSPEDIDYTGQCLQSCLLWPIAMNPPRDRKRLIPYLFAWTQNFLGVLLILRMVEENVTLRKISQKYLNGDEAAQTVHLLLDWFSDMRQIDGIAAWAWTVLSHLYSDYLSNPRY
ncbi:Polyubiquitin [Venturia nashicola]|uniref:Polyubiquitin n=1 Tax=Venturia nashicola TaxID=86259 RepID=A0A4Z1NKA5_9PEZI|nr:Polyubiquitin [Venturia nashicola]